MKQAIREAERAFEIEEVPVGAVIVHEGKIIGKGHNQIIKLNDSTAHAEMIALTSAANYLNSSRLNECTIYVTLEPCVMCAGALVSAKVNTLYFGAFDPKAGACGTLFNITQSAILNHQVKTIGGILEDECKFLLQSFFEKRRLVN